MKSRIASSLIVTLICASAATAQTTTKPFKRIKPGQYKVTYKLIGDYLAKKTIVRPGSVLPRPPVRRPQPPVRKPVKPQPVASNYTVSGDGQHLACILEKDGERNLMLDEKAVKKIDHPTKINFIPHAPIACFQADNSVFIGDHKTPPMMIVLETIPRIEPVVFSPDGKRWAYFARGTDALDNKGFMIIDGKEAEVDGVVRTKNIHFSKDSKTLAYLSEISSMTNPAMTVVIGKVQSEQYQGKVSDIHYSDDLTKAVFAVKVKGSGLPGSKVVLFGNGKFTDIGPGRKPALNADGKKLIYDQGTNDAETKEKGFLYIDEKGEKQTIKDCCYQLTPSLPAFSPVSGKLCYMAKVDGGYQIVMDGKTGAVYHTIYADTIHFSPDGSKVAYKAVNSEGKQILVVNDKEYPNLAKRKDYSKEKLNVFGHGGAIIYRTEIPGKGLAVSVNGKCGAPYYNIRDMHLLKDGTCAYTGCVSKVGEKVVIGEKAGRPFKNVPEMIVSPNGQDVAFIVYMDKLKRHELYVNNVRIGTVATEESFGLKPKRFPVEFTPDGGHVVTVATVGRTQILQIDGVSVYPANFFIDRGFGISSDGKVSAFCVKNNKIMKVTVEIKG